MKKILHIFLFLISLNFAYAGAGKQACFKINGMSCATCSITTKAAIKKLAGIKEVLVSFEEKSAVVDYDSSLVSSKEIKSKIDSVGYEASETSCKIKG
ncbi:MAG: cation transporter [Bacteriovoracaceae bacterium]|nr:cation transporter [Bacteriovoracaceae bacterium]